MDSKRERRGPTLFEPSHYRFVPRLRDVENTFDFGHHCIEVFLRTDKACPEPAVKRARQGNTWALVDHNLWVLHGVERVEDDVPGAHVAKLCFRAEEFSARLRELGPQGDCELTRNLLHLFLLGGRLHLDVDIDGDERKTAPLLLELGYRRVSAK